MYVVFDSWKFEAFHFIILVCHFYFFQNGLMGLQSPKGWHFIKEINIVLHKILNWGFQNFRPIFFWRALFFSCNTCSERLSVWVDICIINILRQRVKVLVAGLFLNSNMLWYAQNYQWAQNSIFPNGKHTFSHSLINSWNLSKWNISLIMLSLKCGQPY